MREKIHISKDSVLKIILVFSLISYLTTLFHMTLFKYVSITEVFKPRTQYFTTGINLVPFADNEMFDIIGNTVLFFPFGFLLCMFFRKIKLSSLAFAVPFLTSLTVEVLQYVLKLGVADTTDLICNSLGAVLGVLFYSLFCMIFKKHFEKANTVLVCFIGAFAVFNLCLGI